MSETLIIIFCIQNECNHFPPTTSKDNFKEIATGSWKPRIGWLAVNLSLNIKSNEAMKWNKLSHIH